MKRVKLLLRKEWSEVFKNRFVLVAVAFVPLVLVVIPLGILYGIISTGDVDGFSLAEYADQFAAVCGTLNNTECNQFVIITQFLPMFLMMPVIIPITIAAYSIVGEKATRTLEPLLATPISTMELLAGKGLAAVLPAIFATWAGYFIFVIGALLIGLAQTVIAMLFSPLWVIGIFVVGPLLAFASVSLAVMVSSRTSDPRVAEQISGLLILPVVGLLVAQVSGTLLLDVALMGTISLVLVVLDAVLLYFAAHLFERETILTRWK